VPILLYTYLYFHFPNYPNEYGGAYYRDEKLCVCLTNTNENIQLYFSSLVDHPEILEFVPVKTFL
jgi:hypothetical protein